MLYKTRGVVLHKLKYSDNSIIVKIYTEQFGIQSYIQQGIRSKKSGTKLALFQPAALLEMEVYRKENRDLQKIKEAKASHAFTSIPFDFKKSAVALFLAEVLYKTLQEEEANPPLFEFIYHSIKKFDEADTTLPDFHLVFLVQLTNFLGFAPQGKWGNNYFDMNEGIFTSTPKPGNNIIEPHLAQVLWEILQTEFTIKMSLKLSRKARNQLLGQVLEYYYLHLSGMREIKSHQVLESVMD